jgi:serine/threonine-protein kinase
MGDVYVAEDTKLDRKVALKVLPPEMASDPERRARFEREAKAVAALNHPHIVTVYSVEKADETHFITMELVRGKTLTELIPKQAAFAKASASQGLPLNKFFEIAIPLTDAYRWSFRR